MCSIERIGDTLLQHTCVFLFLLLAGIGITGSAFDVALAQQLQPAVDLALQAFTLVLETLVLQEHILSGLACGVHVISVGHKTANGVETTKL